MMNVLLIVLVLIVLGLAFGSFINALVWRVYKQSKIKKGSKENYSILSGRSMCPNCHHRLAAADLVPVVSWLLLKGKCRYCHKPISVMYPIVELITCGLFIVSYIYWPLMFNHQGIFYFIVWLILLVGLIALTVYDIKWLTLPNKILYVLFGVVIIQIVVTLLFFSGDLHYLLDALLGFLIGGGVFYILFQISSGKWIGGGDVKLGALLGLYLGSSAMAILMIFFASVLGSLYSLPLVASGKMKRQTLIPYGPFLIASAIILRLFGSSIISWLNNRGISI